MKKYLLIVLLVGVGFSQTFYAGLGSSYNIYNEDDIDELFDMSPFNGYQFGVEHSLNNINLGIGINLTGNRAKLKTTQIEVAERYKYMSAHLTYRYPIKDKYLPFVGIMIGNHVFADAIISGNSSSQESDIDISPNNALLVGLDYMLLPTLGLRFTYSHGLNDIGKDVEEPLNWKNRTFYLSLLINSANK